MAGKEAVVFILDASPTMGALYPSPSSVEKETGVCPSGFSNSRRTVDASVTFGSVGDLSKKSVGTGDDSLAKFEAKEATTRLSCAKSAIESMVSDLMLRSKTNECGVVVLKTADTRHHLAAEEQVADGTAPFPNLIELSEVRRPDVNLLRAVRAVRVSAQAEGGREKVRGDFCDGIVLAADAMHRRTVGKRYRRKIILFTDAEHEVRVDGAQIMMVVDGLKKMECTLIIIGLDFSRSAHFENPAEEGSAEDDRGCVSFADQGGNNDDETDDDQNDDDSNNDAVSSDNDDEYDGEWKGTK